LFVNKKLDALTLTKATGVNIPNKLVKETAPGKMKFTMLIPANSICLFILQPNIFKDSWRSLNGEKFEIRGNVEIFVSSFSLLRFNRLILTPECRETSLKIFTDSKSQSAQLNYSLPIANGDSSFNHKEFTPSRLGNVLTSRSLDTLKIAQYGFQGSGAEVGLKGL